MTWTPFFSFNLFGVSSFYFFLFGFIPFYSIFFSMSNEFIVCGHLCYERRKKYMRIVFFCRFANKNSISFWLFKQYYIEQTKQPWSITMTYNNRRKQIYPYIYKTGFSIINHSNKCECSGLVCACVLFDLFFENISTWTKSNKVDSEIIHRQAPLLCAVVFNESNSINQC